MLKPRQIVKLVIAATFLLGADDASGETLPFLGRVSLFGSSQRSNYANGTTSDYTEITSSIRFGSVASDADGLEYAFDLRSSAYPSSTGKNNRSTIYDAWVGSKSANNTLAVRVGQMWLTDLGSVGSIGGAAVEYRAPAASALGRFRVGLFAGLEPESFDIGYVKGVHKGGAWIALDGPNSRRNTLGYVMIKDSGLTERSVITMTNFVPAGRELFIYQALEYDLTGPGGADGGKGLSYFFLNARYVPTQRVEVMATYHRGNTIDTRTITQDILNGRPVDQKSLDGFLYESYGGRITLEVVQNVRIFGGYSSDTNNRDDKPAGRINAGIWATNIARSGFDFTISDNRVNQTSGTYDAWYASLGRSFGSKLYLSADYSTSLSLVKVFDSGGTIVVNRPETRRYSLNGVWNATRSFSFIFTAEQLKDENENDDRAMLGLSYRF